MSALYREVAGGSGEEEVGAEGGRRKAEGRRRRADGRGQTAEGRRRKAEGGRRTAVRLTSHASRLTLQRLTSHTSRLILHGRGRKIELRTVNFDQSEARLNQRLLRSSAVCFLN